MNDAKSNPHQPDLLCIHALAYNWEVSPSITRVELDPVVPESGGDLPPDLILPIKAFASPRSVEVPPQEGLLVSAVLSRQQVGHDFRINSIRFQQGPIHGVQSQAYVIKDWSQQSAEELALAWSQLISAAKAGDRRARQSLIQMQNQWPALPSEWRRQRPSAHLSGKRPRSWQEFRRELLEPRADLPGLDDASGDEQA